MNEERRRKWTEEEDEQLLAILNTYPGNNEYCFKKAVPILNRSLTAIRQRYAKNLKQKDKRRIITPTGVMTPMGCLRFSSFFELSPNFFTRIRATRVLKIIFKGYLD